MFKNIIKNNKGVTLLEIIVAVSLFTVVVLSTTEIFRLVISGQRDAIASQNVQESMRYSFEAMAKEIRMATLGNHECESLFSPPVDAENKIYNIASGDNGEVLYFKNKNGDCVAYYSENGAIMVRRGNKTALTTPAKIKITKLGFEVIDNPIDASSSAQPLVTIRIDIEAVGQEIYKGAIKMQTTLSSRYYEQ